MSEQDRDLAIAVGAFLIIVAGCVAIGKIFG